MNDPTTPVPLPAPSDERIITSEARMDAVTLRVGDLDGMSSYYENALALQPLDESAGGYHHHLGINSWQSRGAGPRAASLGLGEVAVTVPGREDLDALIARLRFRAIPFEDTGRSVTATDPWGTRVSVGLPNPTAPDLLG